MNPAIVLTADQYNTVGSAGIIIPLIGATWRVSAKQLPSSTSSLINNVASFIEDLVLQTLGERTAEGFVQSMDKVFPDYYRATRALSDLIKVMVTESVIERLVDESLNEMENDFKNEGLQRFGSAVRDQAVFTVWTYRKISCLANEVNKLKPTASDSLHDRNLMRQFSFFTLRSKFNLDCLAASMRIDKVIFPEVLPRIVDGLRGAVNAYGLMRQVLDLRKPKIEPVIEVADWDEEDQELLDASMEEEWTAMIRLNEH